MADKWFYGRGADINGPVTSNELVALVGAGTVIASDTVWQDGNEDGVPARQVNNLFASAAAAFAAPSKVPAPRAVPVQAAIPKADPDALQLPPTDNELVPIDESAPTQKKEIKKARAVAGRGTVIIGQDGTNVKFRMKCTKCGHEDSSWKSAAITRGTIRRTYFCPKCRKKCDCELNCVT